MSCSGEQQENEHYDANAIAHIIKDSLFAELDGVIAFAQHEADTESVLQR